MFQNVAGKKCLDCSDVATARRGVWPIMRKPSVALVMWVGLASAQAESLPQLLKEALQSNPSVLAGQARAQATQLGIESAEWQRYPTPFFNIETSEGDFSTGDDDEGDYVASLGFEQPLWTGGRLDAGVRKARATHNSSLADARAARREVALGVIKGYGGWMSAYLKRRAWENSLKTHEALRVKVRRRAEQGVSSKSDLALADGRLASTRADLSAARAQENVTRLALARLLGRTVKSTLHSADRDVTPQVRNSDTYALLTQAQTQSPAVSRATAELAVLGAEIGETESALWPDVYMRFEYRRRHRAAAGSDSSGTRVSLGMRSTLGAGLSSLNNIGVLQAQHDAAVTDVEIQRRIVDEQVSADLAMLRSFVPRVEALQLSLDVAKTVSESYGRQFLAGRKTWLDVMNAARDLVNTEVQLADASGAAFTVSWRLAVVTQGVDAVLKDMAP